MSDVWFITMPKLGETVTEGTVSAWHAAVGDTVALDDVLLEISTDKVDSEIPSPAAGVVLEILVAADETVPVGTALVRLGVPGTVPAPPAAPTPPSPPGPSAPTPPPSPATPSPAPGAPVHVLTMPKLGETVTEGTVTTWAKQVGDTVALDDVLLEISTDKVDSEIPSPLAGELLEILVPAGETVPVGTVLARIGSRTAATATTAITSPGTPPSAAAPGVPGVPVPRTSARVLSPLVRRRLAETGLDAATLTGTGTGGRLRREDVERAAAALRTVVTAPPAPVPAPATPTDHPVPAAPAPAAPASSSADGGDHRDRVVALSRMRLTIGARMSHSLRTAPHVWTSVEVDLHAVERARAVHKDRFRREEGAALSPLPFVAHAVCAALRAFPAVNSSLDEAGRNQTLHGAVHLAFAVDLQEQGLVAPVVRDADTLSVRGLARAVSTTAARAVAGRLGADDLTGSTFTVTSPGPIADYASAPIINQPNAAILSLNKVTRRPVAIGDAIAIRPITVLGFSYDHRAFDGVTASRFMAHVRDALQDRDWTAELT